MKRNDPRNYGRAKGIKIRENYFPPANTLARQEIERIAHEGDVPLSTFKLSTAMFGKMVASGLINVQDNFLSVSGIAKDYLANRREVVKQANVNTVLRKALKAGGIAELKQTIAKLEAESQAQAS